MKLPHANLAAISESKLVDYLLNPAHADNGGKAAFFLALGFSLKNWPDLVVAFRRLALESTVTDVVESPYGTKYVIDGWLQRRDNKRATVRAIWIIDRGTDIPRLVTAYPTELP